MKRIISILLLLFSITAMYGQRVYTFATVTDAARATYIGIGSTVLTEGYHSSGDGGGAHYKMMAIGDAPMVADSGYVYPVTPAKVLVQVLTDEYLHTATYGVVCGSSAQATNNFNRLQRFFNAIDTLDKQAFVNGCNDTIYVNFTSALTTTLTSHDKFVMRGEGADVTRIKATTGSIDFGFSDAAKVNLFDLYLDGYDATALGGIGGADQSLTYVNDTLTISGGNYVVITGGGGGGTDDQTLSIDSNANTFTLAIESGNSVQFSRTTNTDDQAISLDSTATSYTATVEDGGSITWAKVTDTDTDDQTLSFSNPNLSISGGNSVDISGIDTDTDDQTLSIDSNATTYTLTIVDGNNVKFAKGGGGSPGGTHNDLQINRSGSFTGTDSLEWVGATGYLKVLGRIDQTYGGTSTALGYRALVNDDGTNNNNVTIGYDAFSANITGNDNVVIGANAFKTATNRSSVVAIGSGAGQLSTSGSAVFIGQNAGVRLTGAIGNTIIGREAMSSRANSGQYNTVLGYQASLLAQTNVDNIVSIGAEAFRSVDAGDNSIAIGRNAGRYKGSGTSLLLQTDNSIYIGYQTRAGADSISNETVIGYDLVGNGANTVTIGNSSVTDTHLGGTVHSSGAYIGKVTTFNTASGQTTYGDYICLVDYTSTGIATLTIDTDNLVSGYTLIIKDMDGNAGANTITIATEGAETIDGASTATITTNYGAVMLFSDGVNWYTF